MISLSESMSISSVFVIKNAGPVVADGVSSKNYVSILLLRSAREVIRQETFL
ncbi:MAG: hypothetical protein JXA44_07320 [Methanospirillaceae archaeon]|nr:hypothetical protein [Methanospirillaceae archaeon]